MGSIPIPMIKITTYCCFCMTIFFIVFSMSCSNETNSYTSSKEKNNKTISTIISEIESYYGLYDKIECDISSNSDISAQQIKLFEFLVNTPSKNNLIGDDSQKETKSDPNTIIIDGCETYVLYIKRIDNNGNMLFVELDDIKSNINKSINNNMIWFVKTETKKNIKSLNVIINKNEWLCFQILLNSGETRIWTITTYYQKLITKRYSYNKSKSFLYFRVESPLEGIEKAISEKLNKNKL